MSKRDASLPLPTYGTHQKDFSSKKAWQSFRARKAGYKSYADWQKERRKEGIEPQRQGKVKLNKKGVYKRKKPVLKAYRQKKTKREEKLFYYDAESWEDLRNKLVNIWKNHKTDVYLVYMNPMVKQIKSGSPSLKKAVENEKPKNKLPITLSEYNEFTSIEDIDALIEEMTEQAETFTEEDTPFVEDFTIIRKKL